MIDPRIREMFDRNFYFMFEGKVFRSKPSKISFVEIPGDEQMHVGMMMSFSISMTTKSRPKTIEKYSKDCFTTKGMLVNSYTSNLLNS